MGGKDLEIQLQELDTYDTMNPSVYQNISES